MLVLTTRDIIYKHDMHPIPGNTILEVVTINSHEYRVVRGEYERTTIKASNCVPYIQPSASHLYSYESKKVAIPRDVAEAIDIELEKRGASTFSIMDSVNRAIRGNPLKSREIATIAAWLEDNPFRRDEFISALVNGYTVEESQSFLSNRKLDYSEIQEVRRWYKGALLREADGRDPDGFAKEAIEEVALYLGGAELLEDISQFCKTQLERENKQSG